MEWEPLFDIGCVTGKAVEIIEETFCAQFQTMEKKQGSVEKEKTRPGAGFS